MLHPGDRFLLCKQENQSEKTLTLNLSSNVLSEMESANEFLRTNGCINQVKHSNMCIEDYPEKFVEQANTKCPIFLTDTDIMCSSKKNSPGEPSVFVPNTINPRNSVGRTKGISVESMLNDDMTPEIAFTQYQRHSEDQVCQICGQPSVGFHHRAYVCEACKKFFTRHLNTRTKKDKSSEGEKGVLDTRSICPMGGKCKIEGPGRGKCPHCRFQKCLDLGMSLTPPGGEMGCDVSKIPCRVCGGSSSGFHFGALTCEGCKGFFRRTVMSATKPDCLGDRNCLITPANRNMCKSCRFQRCLDVGMSQNGSRIGRQPNAIKYYCVREISKLVSKGEAIQKRPRFSPMDTEENNNNAVQPGSVDGGDDSVGRSLTARNAPEKIDGYWSRRSTFSASSTSSASSQNQLGVLSEPRTLKRDAGRCSSALNIPSGFSLDTGHRFVDVVDGCSSKSSQLHHSFPSYFSVHNDNNSPPVLTSSLGMPGLSAYDPQTEFTRPNEYSPLQPVSEYSRTVDQPTSASSFEADLKSGFLGQISPSTQNWIKFMQNSSSHFLPPISAAAAFSQAAEVCLQQRLLSLQQNGYKDAPSAFHPLQSSPPMRPTSSEFLPPSPTGLSVNLADAVAAAMMVAKSFNVPDTSAVHLQHEHQQQRQQQQQQQQKQPLLMHHSSAQQSSSFTADQDQPRVISPQESAVQEGSRATSETLSRMNTAVTVTLMKFTEGIVQAAQFLREERNKLKLHLSAVSPRFTMNVEHEIVWKHMMRNFEIHSKMVVSFTKLIPGFNQLELNDRRSLVRAAMYPLMLVHLSRDFKMNGRPSYNYFDFSEQERHIILQMFPSLNKVASHLVHSGEVFHIMKLDDMEMTLICVQELLRHKADLVDPASCQHLFLLSMQVLVNHEQSIAKPEVASERLTAITQLLPMLNCLNVEHHNVLNTIRTEYPNLPFPSLYLEMFAIDEQSPPTCFQGDNEFDRGFSNF